MAVTAAPSRQEEFGRLRPAASFVLASAFIAGHHWYATTEGTLYPKLVLFLFMVAGWAAGGLFHPPIFYSLTKWGKHLPTSMKVLGAAFGMAGFGVGMYVLFTLYGRF